MHKLWKKILGLLLLFILQINLSLWANNDNSLHIYKIHPLGCDGDLVYYMISSIEKADTPLSFDTLKTEFFREVVDINEPIKIHPSELPSRLEYSDIKVNIIKQYFSQSLITFPLNWGIVTDENRNKCSIFFSSQIADKKISVMDLPFSKYENALDLPVEIENLQSYLFEPHRFVMITLIKIFKSPEITEKIPVVQTYSWDKFYNTFLLKICRLLNNVGMSLYGKGDFHEAYKYFLSAQHEKLPIAYYNTACMCALLNDIPGVINHLKKYAQAKPELWKKKVKKDRDFDIIRKTSEFQDFLKNYGNEPFAP